MKFHSVELPLTPEYILTLKATQAELKTLQDVFGDISIHNLKQLGMSSDEAHLVSSLYQIFKDAYETLPT